MLANRNLALSKPANRPTVIEPKLQLTLNRAYSARLIRPPSLSESTLFLKPSRRLKENRVRRSRTGHEINQVFERGILIQTSRSIVLA